MSYELMGALKTSSNFRYGLVSGIGLCKFISEGLYVCDTSKWYSLLLPNKRVYGAVGGV